MRIHIFGASGSGVTTLGQSLSTKLAIPYFDADDYYWVKTDPPYQIKTDGIVRNKTLSNDLEKSNDWILGGSLDSWADELKENFDLVVYLWLPKNIREKRLIDREKERYGETLSQKSIDFIDWSLAYDDSNRKGRNKVRHEKWMETLRSPVVRIEGDVEIVDKMEIILSKLKSGV